MHSWIAASMPPSHRRREKDTKRKSSHLFGRENKHHNSDNLDPDLLTKILQSNIKDGGKDPSRPNSLLSPSYNTLSKSCEDMSKCGSSDAGYDRHEVDKVPVQLGPIIHDKRYVGLVPAAYVSRSRSHNDIIIQRRLVNPSRSKTSTPNSLPSAYMEERYVIRIKKGHHHPHKLHKSSSGYLKPANELSRSLSAHNLNADSSDSSQGGGGHGSGGNHHRHEIITTFGCAPNSAPSSREVSPESVSQNDSANGNYHQHQHHHQQHHPHHHHHHHHSTHHLNNTQHPSEKKPGSPLAQEHNLLHNTINNNNNDHKTSSITKSVEQKKSQFQLDLPKPERRHSFVGGQISYPVSIKSPIRSTDTHSFLSMDGLKKLLTPGGKKTHKEFK